MIHWTKNDKQYLILKEIVPRGDIWYNLVPNKSFWSWYDLKNWHQKMKTIKDLIVGRRGFITNNNNKKPSWSLMKWIKRYNIWTHKMNLFHHWDRTMHFWSHSVENWTKKTKTQIKSRIFFYFFWFILFFIFMKKVFGNWSFEPK